MPDTSTRYWAEALRAEHRVKPVKMKRRWNFMGRKIESSKVDILEAMKSKLAGPP
jgi:ribosome biogenesis GTPase A